MFQSLVTPRARSCLLTSLCLLVMCSGYPYRIQAAEGESVLRQLEVLTSNVKAAEADRAELELRLSTNKSCIQEALKSPPNSTKLWEEAQLEVLGSVSLFAGIAKLCTGNILDCRIKGLSDQIGEIQKGQDALLVMMLKVSRKVASKFDGQLEVFSSHIAACLK